MSRTTIWRLSTVVLMATVVAMVGFFGNLVHPAVARQAATPATVFSCGGATPVASTPAMGPMAMATPMPGMATPAATVEFDRLYIDMMIPHHESIIAVAQAALPRLHDPRLRTIAQEIITTQSAELPKLMGYRQQFYGSPNPAPVDMTQMQQLLPSMPVSMTAMMTEMDAATEVAQFCAASDPDLAFIDITIPHHESAVVASQAALQRAVHPEIKQFAKGVISSQQREIDELMAIRQELYGSATPAA